MAWRIQGAIAQAQLLEAFQAMATKLSPEINPDLDTIILGPGDRHSVLRGSLIELPADYLL